VQWSIIQAARSSQWRMSPFVIPISLVTIFDTVGWHLLAILRGAKIGAEASKSLQKR
jgi:hypothetical protein